MILSAAWFSSTTIPGMPTWNFFNTESKDEEVKEEPDPMDQMQAMNKSMTYMMPIMSVMIAVIAPLGLALYWLMSNILMIIERLVINKIMESKEEKDEEEKANG